MFQSPYSYLLLISPCGVSVAYFLLSPRSMELRERLLVSAHGVFISAMTLLAVSMMRGPVRYDGASFIAGAILFLLSCIVPIVLFVVAIRRFKGNPFVHLAQAVNAVCYLQLLFLGLFGFLQMHT